MFSEIHDHSGGRRTAVVDDVRWLLHRQPLDLGGELAGRSLGGENTIAGASEHGRRPAGFVDDGFEVFNLGLDGLRLRVTAVAVTATVVVEDGEVRRQTLS